MKLSAEKTEICLFSRGNLNGNSTMLKVHVNGKDISYNPNPKVLGLHLDKSLNFQNHIKKTEQKANKAIGVLRQIKHVEKISTVKLVQLYKSLICPILEYACPVWQNADAKLLEEVQRKALCLCLDSYATSRREALEVELGIKPLSIRRQELAIREGAKIISKSDQVLIKKSWHDWKCSYLHLVKTNYNLKISHQKQEPQLLTLSQNSHLKSRYSLPKDDQSTGIDWGHQNQGLKNSRSNHAQSSKAC